MPLPSDAHAALRVLAEKATPGPWMFGTTKVAYERRIGCKVSTGWSGFMPAPERDEDAEYIAAASPDVVLGLLAALADANARITAIAEVVDSREPVDGNAAVMAVRRILSSPAADAHPEPRPVDDDDVDAFLKAINLSGFVLLRDAVMTGLEAVEAARKGSTPNHEKSADA